MAVPLDKEAKADEGGERVGKLDEANGGGDARQAEEVGDGRSDDEGDDPIERHQDGPHDLATGAAERRSVEHLDKYSIIDNLDPDIAV